MTTLRLMFAIARYRFHRWNAARIDRWEQRTGWCHPTRAVYPPRTRRSTRNSLRGGNPPAAAQGYSSLLAFDRQGEQATTNPPK